MLVGSTRNGEVRRKKSRSGGIDPIKLARDFENKRGKTTTFTRGQAARVPSDVHVSPNDVMFFDGH